MKQNKQYIKRNISGTFYLFPTGQAIADKKHGVQLNDTGSFLWDLLEEEISFEELVTNCAEHYDITESELPQLREQLSGFLAYFLKNNIVLSPKQNPLSTTSYYKTLKLAGLKCMLYGSPEAFSDAFAPYLCEDVESPDQTIEILTQPVPFCENGTLLLRNKELVIMETEKKYILLFPTSPQITEVHLQKDGTAAKFYCIPPFTDALRTDLFHALRMTFLYLAQKHNMVAIHSASVFYREQAWLFTGSSGTGKSTHTKLWKDIYNTPIINGDLNLISIDKGKPYVHGIPWCGTSGITDAKTYPLGGIILLKQAPYNAIEELTTDKKQLFTLQRFISPTWFASQLDINLQIAKELASQIMICRLLCTPQQEAANIIKQKIDAYLTKPTLK